MSSALPILLLKTKSVPNDGYEELFSSSRGKEGEVEFQPTFVPVLEHCFREGGLDVVRTLLKEKSFGAGREYGGMIFTSQRAVEAFAGLVEEGRGNGDPSWPHLSSIPIYTVGPATSRALSSITTSPPLNIHGAETGNGEALAHHILQHYPTIYPSQRPLPKLLFLVGEQRRDIIPKTLLDESLGDGRIEVHELEVYGTGVMESFERDFATTLSVLDSKTDEGIRWVVVFSPTGCSAMLRVLGVLDPETRKVRSGESGKRGNRMKGLGKEAKTYVATIGPTTRDHLIKEFGFEPHVCAEKPSPEGVRMGIAMFIEGLGNE